MHCVEAKRELERFHDGELDSERSILVGAHLSECAACTAALEQLDTLRSMVRNNAAYHAMPNALRRRIARGASPSPFAWLRGRVQFPRWALGGAFATVAAITVAITLSTVGMQRNDMLAGEILSDHVRSLMVDHLSDVASTDQHTVKPWFAGKLDFSPPVTDFADKGYALIGGRLDYLNQKTVAALVYQRRQHRINVFVWPGAGKEGQLTTSSRNGYNMVTWTQNGLQLWAVSDLNAAELKGLVELIRGKAG